MNHVPLVSAIIATYNRAYIVGEAIDSILQQTYGNVEVIVVDDGSTDNTQDKLKEYGDRIRVVYQDNSGPAAAWNCGIEASQGEIIAFLGSDDLWLPTFVQRHVSLLEQAGGRIPCCLSNAWLRLADGSQTTSFESALLYPEYEEGIWLNVTDVISTRFILFGQTVAIRRCALKRMGGFDKTLRYLEDYDVALRLSLQGPWGFVREPLVVWRQGNADSDSLSQEARREPIQAKQNVIKIHQRVLAQLRGTGQFTRLQKRLVKKLKRDRLNVLIAELGQRNSQSARAIGTVFHRLDHYSYGLLRRSPWFPKMKTRRLDCRPTSSEQTEVVTSKAS